MRRDTRIYVLLLFFAGIVIGPGSIFAQEDTGSYFFPVYDTVPSNFGLFENDELLEVTLRFDITWFMKNKPEDQYMDALLTYRFNDLDSVNRIVKLRSRGNFRHRTCPFPPIRINLEGTDMGYSDLSSMKNIKLVTHCRPGSELYEDYMLKEYLIYRMLNIITDYSFRVRLLKINYIDVSNQESTFTNYAFLIEPVDVLEDRMRLKEIEGVNPKQSEIDEHQADMVAMFQFMIGNYDWYLPTLHNLKLFSHSEGSNGKLVAIPYDFDYSGFVNTEYAVAREELNLESVRDRAYIGPCRSDEEYMGLISEFESYRDQIISTIMDFPYLNREIRRDLANYIRSFYSMCSKKDILDILKQHCIEIK